MLKQLHVRNIILVEEAEMTFTPGFNVISGETGSGKSAILAALKLAAGDRADSDIIRHEAEKGVVEAVFDIEANFAIYSVLDEGGIDYEKGEDLIIRREVAVTGKNRIFVNNQPAQLSLLRKMSVHLLEVIGQHANQKILSPQSHMRFLDLFAGIADKVLAYSNSWNNENTLRNRIESMVQDEAKRLREIEICKRELEEIQEAALEEGEEERLFAEYTKLINAEELAAKTNELMSLLHDENGGALLNLHRGKQVLESICKMDPSTEELANQFSNTYIELQEISYSLQNSLSRIEPDPERTEEINARLSLINKLKKKYGSTIMEIQDYLQKCEEKLDALENTDHLIETYRCELKQMEEKNRAHAAEISSTRQATGPKLEKKIEKLLSSMNMASASFQIKIRTQPPTSFGIDKVEFHMIPNVGEKSLPLSECASGGELSRVLLALQTILAGKENKPTLVFDEIDANIGGETASVVGANLREIGLTHQVLCVTHFAQVAKSANHHLQISKKTEKGRTFTIIKHLDPQSREHELMRMQGKAPKIFSVFT